MWGKDAVKAERAAASARALVVTTPAPDEVSPDLFTSGEIAGDPAG
jgi:hypothetical protein